MIGNGGYDTRCSMNDALCQSPITNYGFPQITAVNAGEMTENLIIKDLTPKLLCPNFHPNFQTSNYLFLLNSFFETVKDELKTVL